MIDIKVIASAIECLSIFNFPSDYTGVHTFRHANTQYQAIFPSNAGIPPKSFPAHDLVPVFLWICIANCL